jgi:hypothetical protein
MSAKLHEPPVCDDRLLWDIWLSTFQLPALTVADELGLFAVLDHEPLSEHELASRLSLGPRAIRALTGMLVSLGMLVRHADRLGLAGPARAFLLPDRPFYWGGVLRLSRVVSVTHAMLLDSIRNDRPFSFSAPGTEISGGATGIWEQSDPALLSGFTRAMHSHSFPAAVGLARSGELDGVQRLLDVAGGSGAYCIALALRYPSMMFTVLDLPVVASIAGEYAVQYAVADQVSSFGADMFEDAWPSRHDAVLLADVLHDWEPATCRRLVERALAVLPPRGRIFLHEIVLSDTRDGPLPAAAYSMSMMLSTRGQQFTGRELIDLLQSTGFEDVRIRATYGYYSVVVGRKP